MSSYRMLLTCGAVAGPVYVLVAAAQALTREGFDPTRHPVSLLSNGELGWIQLLNFVVVGSLVVASAFGLRAAQTTQPGSPWGPLLIGVFGAGLIASGIFVADPADGFPPGTPAGDPSTVSVAGMMHFMVGGVSFLSLIAACAIYARRFAEQRIRLLAVFSALAGALYFVGFAMIATLTGPASTLIFTGAVILGWAWLSVLCMQTLPEVTTPSHHVAQPA
jgi:hypothetical protein